jgi:hypothetical protein
MQRHSFPWFWVALAALLLLFPGPAARLLLDVIGGLTLLAVLLPLLAAGAGFLAWQALRRRLVTCEACGTTSFGGQACPACGAPLMGTQSQPSYKPRSPRGMETLEAGQVTIDVESVDVSASANGEPEQTP